MGGAPRFASGPTHCDRDEAKGVVPGGLQHRGRRPTRRTGVVRASAKGEVVKHSDGARVNALPNMSIDTDPQQRAAAAPLVLVVRSSLR
jgi:hypothetical protein